MNIRKLIVILVLLLVGCMPAASETDVYYNADTDIADYVEVAPYVYRFIDESAGVVCWYREGISCLPLNETELTP